MHAVVEHAQAVQGAPSAAATLGETRAIDDNEISSIARRIVPFAGQATRSETPSPREPELTLEQHASLHVELEMQPERAVEILRRYGLTEAQHARLDASPADASELPVATVVDNKPMVNIAPFGMYKTQTNPQVALLRMHIY